MKKCTNNTEGFSWKIVDFYTQHFSNMYTLYEMLSSTSQDMESHLQRAGKSCYVKYRKFLLQGDKNQLFCKQKIAIGTKRMANPVSFTIQN